MMPGQTNIASHGHGTSAKSHRRGARAGDSQHCVSSSFLIDCKTPGQYSNNSRHFNQHQAKAERSSKDKAAHLSQDNHLSTALKQHPCAPLWKACPRRCQLPYTALRALSLSQQSIQQALELRHSQQLSSRVRQQFFRWRNALHLSESFKPLTELPTTPVSPFLILPCSAMAPLPCSPGHLSPLCPDQLMDI